MSEPTPTVVPRGLAGEHPHVTIAFIPYRGPSHRSELEFVMLRRGKNVRSVPDQVSVPTGLLDHGENIIPALLREAQEELGFRETDLDQHSTQFHGVYENIPGDGFHWVILVYSIRVIDPAASPVNLEPDKHDWVRWVGREEIERMLAQEEVGQAWLRTALHQAIDDILGR